MSLSIFDYDYDYEFRFCLPFSVVVFPSKTSAEEGYVKKTMLFAVVEIVYLPPFPPLQIFLLSVPLVKYGGRSNQSLFGLHVT